MASEPTNSPSDMWTYKGWSIEVDPCMGRVWTATGPNYDASYEGPEDGWVSNGESVSANSYKDLLVEIEGYIDEHL